MARETQIILQCREHSGGRFTKPAGRRGRNPVRCNPEEGWGCSASETAIPKPRISGRKHGATPAVHAAAIKADLDRRPIKRRGARKDDFGARVLRDTERAPIEVMENVPVKSRVVQAELDMSNYPTDKPMTARKLPEGAQASKKARDAATATLEGLEWVVSGKGWAVEDGAVLDYHASLTCSRGVETLYLEWVNGKQVASDYAIMDTVKPSNNKDMPEPELPFDPEEVPDWQLVQMISGNKITWWNTLGSLKESAVCGKRVLADDGSTVTPPRVSIEHVYSGDVGPLGVDRLIKFIDGDGGGMRLIKVGALLKVG